jgi:lipoprotein-anchoring transpeptidase ErfK/SrfK
MIKKLLASLGLVLSLFVIFSAISEADTKRPGAPVSVTIDISSQSMAVRVNGWHYASWKVSTARSGYWTPRGNFRVQRMARVYYSRKYDNSPMPNSLFFKGGYAIHGSNYLKSLGRPASHGCIRLHPSNAARLYSLVQQHGARNVRITIVN